MDDALHIISGDSAGESLETSGVPGEVFVWRDVLYEGPRKPGWPDAACLEARARFLDQTTGGSLGFERALGGLRNQYRKLEAARDYECIVLWFDACLFDQSMLAHILTCMKLRDIGRAELLCVDAYPGIEPFHGLGQLTPSQMASLYERRRPVTSAQFQFAEVVDKAFAVQDSELFQELAHRTDPPLPWVPAAVARWLQEKPDPASGLGRLESLALQAIRDGHATPPEIFKATAAADTPPQYWGDTTLWARINALADRKPPLVRIEGPTPRLPQWDGVADLKLFRISILPNGAEPVCN